jgi:hypothetical protein
MTLHTMPLPDGMPARVLTDRWWLKTYGLTPDQVRGLPLEDFEWFPLIERAEAIAAERSKPAPPRPQR